MKMFFAGIFIFTFILPGCKNDKIIEPVSGVQLRIFNYLPESSRYVMFMDIGKLKKTNFWNDYFKPSLKSFTDYKWVKKIEKETNINLGNSVSGLFVSSDENNERTVVVVFNKNTELKKYFGGSDSFTKKELNRKVFYGISSEKYLQFFFINDSTLLVTTSPGYLKKILRGVNKSLKDNHNFISVIENIKNKNQYWIATNEGNHAVSYVEKLLGIYDNYPVNKILKSIESISLSAEFDDEIEIESSLNFKDSKNAYLLATAIKGALAMDLLSDKDYLLGKILQKTEVDRDNSLINLQLELNDEDIYNLKNIAVKKNLVNKL